MEAVVFAAGRGTRLGDLTRDRPKALVEVAGVPLLERVARRLVEAGVRRLVVTACPFADRVEAFVRERRGFGVDAVVSREGPEPYETGGGLLRAAPLLARDGPVLLHNVDVLTDLPLADLVEAHRAGGALATLAVAARPSSRRLLFDARGLVGRADDGAGVRALARPPVGEVLERAFAGVHVVAPALFDRLSERGRFPILEPYLRLAGEGAVLAPFSADGCAWVDVGRPADLARASAALAAAGA